MAIQQQGRQKNIKRYKNVKGRLRTHRRSWITQIHSGPARSQAKEILYYSGVGVVKIPGSFLTEAQKITNLPVNHLAQVLDMSTTSYYRVQKGTTLDMETVDKLSSLFKVYQKGNEAFEAPQAFDEWLNTKITNLGDQKPIDLLKTENGRAAVLDAIYRVEYGIYG